jgi:hypothetical protein
MAWGPRAARGGEAWHGGEGGAEGGCDEVREDTDLPGVAVDHLNFVSLHGAAARGAIVLHECTKSAF